MKLTDIFETKKGTCIINGEKKPYYNTKIEHITFGGYTKEQSQKFAIEKIKEHMKHSDDRFYAWTKKGTLFHLFFNHCWTYQIICQGKNRPNVTTQFEGKIDTFEKAKKKMLEFVEVYED